MVIPRHDERAFSLIEVLIAAILLSVILGAATMAIGSTDRTNGGMAVQNHKADIARRAIEEVKSSESIASYCREQWTDVAGDGAAAGSTCT